MPGSYELIQNGVLDGVPVMTRFHIGTPDEAENSFDTAQAIVDYWVDSLALLFLAIVPEDYLFGPAVCRGIIVENGGSWTTAKAANFEMDGDPGAREGEILSNQSGPLIEWVTNSEGISNIRQRLGKTFIPGIVEVDAANNEVMGTGLLIDIASFASNMLANWTLGIGFDGILRTLAQLDEQWFFDIASFHIRKFIASQRRRRPKWDLLSG